MLKHLINLNKDKYVTLLDFFAGVRVIIMTEKNSSVNKRFLGLLLKFKTKKINSWCAV